MTAVWGALIGLAAWVLFRLDEKPGLAPDSQYYVDMMRGKPVPVPFCWRWLWPIFLTKLGKSTRAWETVVLVSLMAQGAAIAHLAHTPLAAVLLMGLPGGARFSVRHPLLVDAPTMAVVLIYACTYVGEPLRWQAGAAGFALGLMRENAPIWLFVLTGQWWALVGGSLGIALGSLSSHRKASRAAGDNLWIVEPLATSLAARRGMWFSPALMVLPWGVVLPLALLSPSWELAGILVAGYLPLVGVSDTARVYQWAAPAVILIAVQAPVPDWSWPFLLLAHVCNPYRGA